MTSYVAVVGASLGATAFFSAATALKHRSAGQGPDAGDLRARHVRRFVAATLRSPYYLAGLCADVGGISLQVFALHIGPLAVVQPLMITALVFSLVLNHQLDRTRMTKHEIFLSLLLVASLGGFLYASGATSPSIAGEPQPADHGPAAASAAVALGLAVACVVISRRLPRGKGAALLGVVVGITYAFTAALIKSCTDVVTAHGIPALLTSWQLPTFVVVAGAGLFLSQLAFQAGPLRASLPAIATVDPLASVLLGVLVYDERLRPGAVAVLAEAVTLALLATAAFLLSRVESPVTPAAEPAPVPGAEPISSADPGR